MAGLQYLGLLQFNYLFIYLLMPPALNPQSYGRARVLEAPSSPMLVIGRSFYEETRDHEAETAEEAETAKAMGLIGTKATGTTKSSAWTVLSTVNVIEKDL